MSVEEAAARKDEYASVGYRVFSIGNPSDSSEFFRAAKEQLPLDPPLSGKINWDAFKDSIYGGLDAACDEKMAIVFDDASQFREIDRIGFEVACECLLESAREVEEDKIADGKMDTNVVVLVGVNLSD